MKKLVVLFTFLSVLSVQAQDTASVEYTFTISDEFNNSEELIIGKDPFGYDGLDPQFGEVFLPQVPAEQFGARLILPTDSTLTTLKDIRFGCEWVYEIEHNIDLSYATGSNHMNINWDWNMPLLSVQFYNPYNGNLIQSFEFTIDSSFFNVPDGLDKIKMIVQYNVPLSGEWFSLINPNDSDTLSVGNSYVISWSGHKMSPCIGIEFTSNGGKTWSFIEENFCLNQLYYQWTVPNIVSDSCRIRIGHYPCAYDTSDTYFSIVQVTPVELLSFSSSVVNDDVTLNWATTTETNNSGFQIERRETKNERSEDWENIGFVNGTGTTTTPQTYFYKDENLSTGKYQYRLKQIDFDGAFEYSTIVEAVILPPIKFSLEQNFPNPFNPSTSIQYAIASKQFVSLKVFNSLGEEVAVLVNEEKPAGKYTIEFKPESSIKNLVSGVYLYQLNAGEFVQTRKMIILK